MIDPDIRDIIAPELMEGEELLWVGKRLKHSKSTDSDIIYWALFLVGWLLALAWLATTLFFARAYLELTFALLGFSFIAFILWKLSWTIAKAERHDIYYAITNQRVLLLEGRQRQSITGRTFFSIYADHSKPTSTIRLLGPGLDDDILEVWFEHVDNGAQAERLLLENFMRDKE